MGNEQSVTAIAEDGEVDSKAKVRTKKRKKKKKRK